MDYCTDDVPEGWVLNDDDPIDNCPSNQYDCSGECIVLFDTDDDGIPEPKICDIELTDEGVCEGDLIEPAIIDDCNTCSGGLTEKEINGEDLGCGCNIEVVPTIHCFDGDGDLLGDPYNTAIYCSSLSDITTNNTGELAPEGWVTNCLDPDDACPNTCGPDSDESCKDECGVCNGEATGPGTGDMDNCGVCHTYTCIVSESIPEWWDYNPCPEGEMPDNGNWNMSCSGCTDSDADNHNFGCNGPCTIDDGSCIYIESDNAAFLEDLFQGDVSNLYIPFTYDYGDGEVEYNNLDEFLTGVHDSSALQTNIPDTLLEACTADWCDDKYTCREVNCFDNYLSTTIPISLSPGGSANYNSVYYPLEPEFYTFDGDGDISRTQFIDILNNSLTAGEGGFSFGDYILASQNGNTYGLQYAGSWTFYAGYPNTLQPGVGFIFQIRNGGTLQWNLGA